METNDEIKEVKSVREAAKRRITTEGDEATGCGELSLTAQRKYPEDHGKSAQIE